MICLTIDSADTKRQKDKEYLIQAELQKQVSAMEMPARVEKIIPLLFEFTKSEMERSHLGCCYITLTIPQIKKWGAIDYSNEMKSAIDTVRNMLQIAGYECEDFYEYSTSWQRRSEKFGYFAIRW